jgi:hypothetical protein
LRAEEAFEGFAGGIHDGLVLVKGPVQQHRHAVDVTNRRREYTESCAP